MTDQPELTAPSPADGPTTPHRPAVSRGEARRSGLRDEGRSVGSRGRGAADVPTRPGAPGAGDGAAGTRPGVPDGTRPGVSDGARPGVPDGAAASRPRARVVPGRTKISGTLIGLVLGAVVLIFLLVFVLQNLAPVEIRFLWMSGTLPLGVWLLFAAIAGVLLLAIPGLGRVLQWRRASGRLGK